MKSFKFKIPIPQLTWHLLGIFLLFYNAEATFYHNSAAGAVGFLTGFVMVVNTTFAMMFPKIDITLPSSYSNVLLFLIIGFYIIGIAYLIMQTFFLGIAFLMWYTVYNITILRLGYITE